MAEHVLNVPLAQSFLQRTVGLIGRTELGPADGLWFDRCSSIHTFFMRTPIDVVFLDRDKRVIQALPNVQPWRPYVGCRGAYSLVELAPGSIERLHISIGDILSPRSL